MFLPLLKKRCRYDYVALRQFGCMDVVDGPGPPLRFRVQNYIELLISKQISWTQEFLEGKIAYARLTSYTYAKVKRSVALVFTFVSHGDKSGRAVCKITLPNGTDIYVTYSAEQLQT